MLSRTRRFAVSGWGVTVAVAAVAGIALRVWVYRSHLGDPNADEATVALMARHMLHGQFTVFIWGEAYGGPLESVLAVPGLAIAGNSWLAWTIVPLGLFLVGLFLVWRTGLRTIGEPCAGAAAALYWVWPPFVLYLLTTDPSFYGFDVLLCALLLLLALRIVERPDRIRVGLFGFVLGVAFWETSQIVPIAVAVTAWTVWKQPRSLRHIWIALPLAVLGALPWIVWNLMHGWASLHLRSGPPVPYGHRLRLFFSPLMPMLFGLRTPGSQAALWSPIVVDAVCLVLFVLFLYGAYRARHRNTSLLYVVAAVFPFVYAIAAQNFGATQPLHLVVLTPVVVLLLAQLMSTWPRAAAILAIAFALSLINLHRLQSSPQGVPVTPPRNLGPLISTLDRLGLDRVYANQLIAYVLDFETRERIIAVENKFYDVTFVDGQVVLPDDPVVHFADYQREVRDSRHGFVFFERDLGSIRIVPALERHGYRRIVVGPLVVFAPPDSR